MILKVKLYKVFKTVLIGQIIEQEGILRRTGDGAYDVASLDGYYIRTYGRPAISVYSLYIRGSEEDHDNVTMYYEFSTEEDLDKWVSRMRLMLKEINTPKLNDNHVNDDVTEIIM